MIQETSREALKSVDQATYETQVFKTIMELGPISNLEVSEVLGLPINTITRPCLRLRKHGLVKESHRGPSPITGHKVIFWKAAA